MDNLLNTINSISMGINRAADEKDENNLQSYVTQINVLLEKEQIDLNAKVILYYDLGNAYYELDNLRNHSDNRIWVYNNNEHINAIKAFRKCINLESECSTKKQLQIFLAQSYTNLGNLFSESGRIIYAIEVWKKALLIQPDLGMTLGNLGIGLITYARNLYDPNHAILLCKEAYSYLDNAINSETSYESAKENFRKYKNYISKDVMESKFEFADYFSNIPKHERKYRQWVLKQCLYINPINDIYTDSFVAHDIMHLPNMVAPINEPPKYHGLFNEIKQQYISARYMYFSYLQQSKSHEKHFSDKDIHLINTFDYSLYGLKYELLKTSYKSLYSILDKIAFFINEYFELGINERKIAFHTIWYEGNQKSKINSKIESLNNNPLRGLYYLSKDFHSDTEYLNSTDFDAKELSDLRNYLEHRYVKVVQYKNNRDLFSYDNFAYQISIYDFENKTEKMLKYVREAIIYLSLAVHTNEEKNYPIDNIIGPIMMSEI